MNTKTKLEQVLELVINEETDKASDLLHDIFVEKSRAIYADLIEEDADVEEVIEEEEYDIEEDIAEDEEEIEAEESSMAFENEDEDDAEMELADELVGDEGEDEGEDMDMGAPDAEEAMMNVEDALAELKAAFAELTGGSESDMDMDDMDMGDEDEMEEGFQFEAEEIEEESEELDEAAKLSAVNVSHDHGTDNTKSTVAGKNDMGGSAKNIAQGSAEEKGRPAPSDTKIGVDGPQEAGKKPRTVKK